MLGRGQECTWEGPRWKWWWCRENVSTDEGDSAGTHCIHHYSVESGRSPEWAASGDYGEGGCGVGPGDVFNSGQERIRSVLGSSSK